MECSSVEPSAIHMLSTIGSSLPCSRYKLETISYTPLLAQPRKQRSEL
jgi:hypothetical protein